MFEGECINGEVKYGKEFDMFQKIIFSGEYEYELRNGKGTEYDSNGNIIFNGEYKFVPVRKPGKLPREVIKVDYDLEYGSNTLCMHKDAINKGDKVLIIDDLLATGGTICACSELVRKLGGEVCGFAFVIELVDLKGREKIELANEGKAKILSLTSYEGE